MALCARNVDMCLAHAPALSEQSLSLSKEICVAKTSVCVCECVCVCVRAGVRAPRSILSDRGSVTRALELVRRSVLD